MRKILSVALVLAGAFLFAVCFPETARAQFTTVTATVTDPNGIPYAGGTMSAVLVPGASGGYRLGGQPYSGQVGPFTLDSTGSFTANFGDVTLISPGSPQWEITVNSNPGGIEPPLGTGGQTFVYTSTGTTISGSSPVSLSVALTALAPKLTNFAGAGTGTIAGTITAFHIPYASAPNTLADIAGSSVTGATGAIALTAGADTTTSLAIASHSATQSATEFDVSNQSTGTPATPFVVRGRGFGSFTASGTGTSIATLEKESDATSSYNLALTSRTANVTTGGAISGFFFQVPDNGQVNFFGGGAATDSNKNYSGFVWDNLSGITLQQPVPNSAGSNAGRVSFSIQQSLGQTGDLLDLKNTTGGILGGRDILGDLFFNGVTSGTAKIGVASVAGTPCIFQLPTTSPTASQPLVAPAPSSGSCQASWAVPISIPNYPSIPTSDLFIGTTGGAAGNASVLGSWDIGIGQGALASVTGAAATGENTALGYQACTALTTGRTSTCVGYQAGLAMTGNGLGIEDEVNTFIGALAGYQFIGSGSGQTHMDCIGEQACGGVTSGGASAFFGDHSGSGIVTANVCTVLGVSAASNAAGTMTCSQDVIIGEGAAIGGTGVFSNNVIIGANAATSTTATTTEVLIGDNAGFSQTTATQMVCVGYNTCRDATTAGSTVAVGYQAAQHNLGFNMVAIGNQACQAATGSGNTINTCVGENTALSGVSDTNETALGGGVTGAGSNTATIGNASVTDTWFGGATGLSKVHGILGQSSTSQKNESALDNNVLTYTPIAAAGSYRIRFVMSVSAATAAVLGWTATWTDSNGNAQTPTNLTLNQSGTAVPALTFTAAGAGNYYGQADVDVNNSATSIVIKLTFTGTSFAAKVSASVERII